MPNMLRCSLLLLATSALLIAGGPALTRVDPPGGRAGTALRLTLVGNGLDGKLTVHSKIPGVLTQLSSADEGKEYLLEIDGEAAVGAYPLQVESEAGLSNTLLFSVSSFPETVEKESTLKRHLPANDSAPNAESLVVPGTVNGTLVGADRDLYRLQLASGDNLTFEVESQRLGSAIDPAIVITDADGKTLVRNNDAAGVGADARLRFVVPNSGTYFVEVHDARFSEQKTNFYRLKVGPVEFAEAIFPLGWTSGEKVAVELSGGSLTKPQRVETTGDRARVPGKNVSLPLPFVRGEGQEKLEPTTKGPHRLADSQVVNGRISKTGETDRYSLNVKEGEEWLIETQAAGLGTSHLYTLLTLHDQNGKKLGSAGDQEPEELLSFIRARDETFGDPHIGFEVPKGVSRIDLTMEDLLGRGGPGYGYRLVARKQPGDFVLRLDEAVVNIPQDGSTSLSVTMDRRGYEGAVRLVVEGVPDDVIVEGGHIPAEFGGMTTARTSRTGRLTLTSKPGAKPRPFNLTVYGEAQLPSGETIRRRALSSTVITRIAGKGQKPLRIASNESSIEARLAAPAAAVLEALTPRRLRTIQGMAHDIRWQFTGRDAGVRPSEAVSLINGPSVANLRILGSALIKKGDTKGVFDLNTTMGTPAMTFDLILKTEIERDGRTLEVVSPAITIEVVQGYQVTAPEKPVAVTPNQPFEISGAFQREAIFESEVVVEAENLPLGVKCQTATIADTPATYSLPCTADAVEPGEHQISIAPKSVLASRDKEAVPYNITPVSATLVVAVGRTIAVAK